MIGGAFFPILFTVLAILSGTTLLVLVYFDNRNSRIDDSINAFRRHIDALSPEARRNSVYRDHDDSRSA